MGITKGNHHVTQAFYGQIRKPIPKADWVVRGLMVDGHVTDVILMRVFTARITQKIGVK